MTEAYFLFFGGVFLVAVCLCAEAYLAFRQFVAEVHKARLEWVRKAAWKKANETS